MSMTTEINIVERNAPLRLSNLHIQYIPYVTPLDLWNGDMGLANSPHVELLQYIKKHGFDWTGIWRLRYTKERIRRREIGWPKWTDTMIRKRIRIRWKIYKSLKERGYKQSKARESPIIVLRKPFWETRFNVHTDNIHGPEIFDGAGRCSAAFVLGWDAIIADIGVDSKPGTCDRGKFGIKCAPMENKIWR